LPVHVALLRSVNTGKRKVLKEDLLAIAEDAGFPKAKTYLASGNLVLWGEDSAGPVLEARLEDALAARIGLRTDFMIRSPDELQAIVAANPFPSEALDHPSHVLVTFMKTPLLVGDEDILRAAITGPERFAARGRELYIDFPISMADSVLDRDWKASKRAPVGTSRNWNTVRKLVELAEG
jgi:uncharacterized protein (DUF1697 family)